MGRGTRGTSAGRRATSSTSEREVRRSFGWLVGLGGVLALGGVLGLLYVGLATITSVLLFGWLLLVSGLVGLVHAVMSRGTNYFWLGLIVAALYLAAGVVVIRYPDTTAEGLTLFAALLFLTGGVFRLVGAFVSRGPEMAWTLVQGAVGVLLGVLVLGSWPESTLYVLGTFFSLALLSEGLGLMAVGFGGRQVVGMVSQQRKLRADGAGPQAKRAGSSGDATDSRNRPEPD